MYEDNYTDSLGYRRNTMDAALTGLFSHTNAETARDINNKVLAFVNDIESELKTTKNELSAFKKNNEELIRRLDTAIASWDEERERALREAARVKEWREKYEDMEQNFRIIGKHIPCTTGGTFENELIDDILHAVVRSLDDLTEYVSEQTHKRNMFVSDIVDSAKEEVEHTKLDHDEAKHLKEKYEDLERYIRFIGKQISCNTGGTFENDPIDAILDAAVRSLNDRKPERVKELNSILDAVTDSAKEEVKHLKAANDKTLDNLEYAIERTKVFEALAEMIYKAEYDNTDAIKKIYEALREKYPVGTYYPPCKTR